MLLGTSAVRIHVLLGSVENLTVAHLPSVDDAGIGLRRRGSAGSLGCSRPGLSEMGVPQTRAGLPFEVGLNMEIYRLVLDYGYYGSIW